MRLHIRNELTKRLWHTWFAWYPVRVFTTWVWLEQVSRRKRGVKSTCGVTGVPDTKWEWEYTDPQ